MISFNKLGHMGRLGNQLFQYAFLRTTAQRLGVKFYCPPWAGDGIFSLNDSEGRAGVPAGINKIYTEPASYTGFNREALEIEDGTDIAGFFQTHRYLHNEGVKDWYSFRETRMRRVLGKYAGIDFAHSAGMHLRFGDKLSLFAHRINFYVPRTEYYAMALPLVRNHGNILVFSDQPGLARRYLRALGGNVIFIQDNQPYEDLYLMTLCGDFILSSSTLSWWGAYLNRHPDCRIVAPCEGPFRPGSSLRNEDYLCPGWIRVRALRRYADHYIARAFKEGLSHPHEIPAMIAGMPGYFYKTAVLPFFARARGPASH